MNTDEIVKSWKDEDYMNALSAAEQALLPENPVGLMELSDEDLLGINGGSAPMSVVVASAVSIAVTIVFVITL
jgi:mersacidin/lichenicidin family type 2 lantibiotic